MENKLLLVAAISIASFLSLYGGMIFFFWKNWSKQPYYLTGRIAKSKVSVIIAMRNEEATIEACLTSLVQQRYPPELMEIICVDDGSSDGSLSCAENFKNKHHSHVIRLLQIPETSPVKSPKKNALELAVQQSSADFLLFTDADCVANPQWINTMLCFYEDSGAKMLCGPVELTSKSEGVLETFERLDFHSLQLSGGASLLADKPLMCNGANLGIARETYLSVSSMVNKKNLASGDDMFMMLAIDQAFPGSVKYVKSVDAKVCTSGQPNLLSLFNQRKRWASKGFHYQDRYLYAVSGLVLLCSYSIVIGIALSFFFSPFVYFMMVVLLVKTLLDGMWINASPEIFKSSKNPIVLFLIEISQAFFILLVSFSTLKKSYSWKNRRLS